MSVVNVAHLETGTVARQTARTKGTQTALVSDFGKRVGLVHELRQSICAKEGVDNRRNCLGINQVGRSEHFVVAHIHAFANSASHTSQAHAKLIVELFANGAHATVAQVVDIVDVGLAVNQADEIFNNLDDIFASEHANVVADGQAQLLVDAETTHITKVVTLVGEEQVGDNFTGTCIIRWLGVAQLTIDICDSLLLRVARVLLKGVEDDLIIVGVHIFLVHQDGGSARFQNLSNVFLSDFGVTLHNHLVALDANNFTGVLVNEVLVPRFHNTSSQAAAYNFLKSGFVYFKFFR